MAALYMGSFLAGCFIGWLLLKLTKYEIGKRIDYSPKNWMIYGKKAPIVWILLTGIVYLGFTLAFGLSLNTLEYVFVFSLCVVISAVDFCIRRIPNGLLILILAGSVIFMVLGNSISGIINHLLGMAVGLVIFIIPFIFGKQAGMGDIKYAAVIGFFLGLYYSLVAMVIMSILFSLYTVILLVSKRGSLKTAAAMGPYMSAGFVGAFILMGNII